MNKKQLEKAEKDAFKKAFKLKEKRESAERDKLRPELIKKYVGKYFKYRNSYGGSDNGWWLYQYVVSLDKDFNLPNPTFYVITFQKTTMNVIEYRYKEFTFQSSLGTEISKTEFMKAHDEILNEINSIFEVKQ